MEGCDMKNLARAGVVALLLAAAAPAVLAQAQAPAAVAASPQAAVDELLAADRAFAAAAADIDVVTALSAMYADDVIVPTPARNFARGKAAAIEVLRANPANLASRVSWTPMRGGVSADGQHGFTYGFMTISEAGKPDRPLKYLAYWVRKPEGWRVAAYRRVGRPAGEVDSAALPPALPAKLVAANPGAAAGHAKTLADAERAFAAEAQEIGLGAAFAKWGRADAMNMGQGAGFDIGTAAIARNFGPEAASPVNWGPDEGTLVASSGDLGVNFGYIRLNAAPPPGQPGDPQPFFTVWRRDSPSEPWRYIAE
jgi:ketosteroid isomerase-like protein